MANNIHYTCELRTQRDPGSPTGRISLPARAGKRSICHSMHSHHTGSIHPSIRSALNGSDWWQSGGRSRLT